MANLKEIRTRITSVTSTRQITSAMKMVSAAKLRKSQDAIIQLRPYANKLQEILNNLSQNTSSEDIEIYKESRDIEKVMFVVVTSNKGLCGGFNQNVVKSIISEINSDFKEHYQAGKIDILSIGKKGAELLKAKKIRNISENHELLETANYGEVKEVAVELINSYLKKKYDLIKIYFNQFKNAATQVLAIEQFLPLQETKKHKFEEEKYDYIFEPSQKEIVEELIPKSLKIKLFQTILESIASEHGARMTAMHKATDNATELIKELQLDYNKARQAAITNEILEIVGGANALKG